MFDIASLHRNGSDADGYVTIKVCLVAALNRAICFASATYNSASHPSSSVLVGVARLFHTLHAHQFIIWSAPRWKIKHTGGISGGSFVMLRHVLGRCSTCGFHQCALNMRAPRWLHVFYVVFLYRIGLLLFVHSVVFDGLLVLYTQQYVEM